MSKDHFTQLSVVPPEQSHVRYKALSFFVRDGWVVTFTFPEIQWTFPTDVRHGVVVMRAPPYTGRRGHLGPFQFCDALLLGDVPDQYSAVGSGASKQVRVCRVPGDSRDGLFMLGHNGVELEFLVILVHL